MRRWVLRMLLAVLVAAVIYAVLAALADVQALRASLRTLDLRAIPVALSITLTAYLVRALRWRLYLHRMGVLEPVGREALGFAATLLMGLASGKGGQVVKAYYLQLATGLPYSISVPATFAERIADVAALLLFLLLGLALAPRLDEVPTVFAALAVVAVLLALRHPRAAETLLRPFGRIPWVRRHGPAFVQGHAQLRGHLTLRELAPPATMGLAAFLLEALALQVLADGLGHPLHFGVAVLAIALADFAGMITFIPGGIGVAEGGLVVLLALYGMPLADATAATLLFRLSTLWFSVALGAMAAGALELATRRARAGKLESGPPPPA